MPFDGKGPAYWDRAIPLCRSCRQPIGAGEATEEVQFDHDPEHRIDELNGTYHAICAKPYLSLGRVMGQLIRAF